MNNARRSRSLCTIVIVAIILIGSPITSSAQDREHPLFVAVAGDDLQAAVDAAPAHSIVLCDRANRITIDGYILSDNLATVSDGIQGNRARIAGNL